MRKIASMSLVALLCSLLAFAQTRTVSGVIIDGDGKPLSFASVTIKGTKTGTTADADGKFILKNVATGTTLVVSAIGFSDREVSVGTSDNLNVVLQATAGANLSEVVVTTALGIKRKPKEIGYATATVKQDQITASKNPNLGQALSGKVSGLTVANTSAEVGATPRITLRGMRSITGDNTALIVLDGVPVPSNTINYINPNDVERVDIMKGGQAATLFGSEGVNGAIIITTKKGSAKPEIVFTHTSNIEQVAYLPKGQTSFGSGSAYGSSREENFNTAENQQFGDAFDGSLRSLGRTLADGSYQRVPYSSIPDMRDMFWDDGYTGQTDLSYRAGDANSNVYLSFQNLITKGVVPGDEFNRNTVRMNAARTYGKFNISFDATYAWDHADRTNTDFYFFSLNTSTWIPTDQYRDWRNNKFADPSGYYNDYYNNPWWMKDNNRFDTKNQYFNGNFKVTYKPTSELEFVARGAVANTNSNTTTQSNSYTYTGFSKTGAFVQGFNNNYDRFLQGTGRFIARTPVAGGIGESQSRGTRLSADAYGSYTKDFGNLSLKAILGVALVDRTSQSIATSTNGIGVPGLYNFVNSSTGLFNSSNSISVQRKIGGFADVTVGFKDFLFLHGVVRDDYTSVFSGPDFGFDDPHFTTYGGDASLILTELFPSLKGNIIDNLKIRGGYNKNGNDNLGAYSLQTVYPNATGFPYSGLVGTTTGNTVVSPTIKPEDVKTAELGFELGLMKNRFSLEGSIYSGKASNQIMNVTISTATGFSNYLLNAADVKNKGFELDAKAVIFKNKDWGVSASANYSYNTNEVLSLYGATGLTNLEYQAPDGLASLNATVGEMFPYLKTTVYERDDQGRIIVDPSDGWPERADSRVGQGTTLPTHNLGVGVNVTFKGFTLIANAEYRGGALMYSDIGTDMTFTGSGAVTTMYNRDQFVWPNSVYWDGTKYVANTNIAVDNYLAIYQGYGDISFSRGFAGVGEMYVSSADFWKLRDLSLSYELPRSIMGKIKSIKGISITAFARNLITLRPDDNWYTDPEFSNTNGNSTGINTSLNTPPTRQMGATIKVTF
jgi:TonB-linked SusC/RagA family outer membrane protein